MINLIYREKVNPAYRNIFLEKVILISEKLSINPNWLMQVMYSESKLNPSAKNIQQGRLIAAGLIQWTKGSGFPGAPESLLNFSALQQLDYVYSYFKPYAGRIKSYYDLYLITFFPAAIGKPDDYVLQTSKLSASLIAKQNPAVNINKDDKITVAEFKQYVKKTVPKMYWEIVFSAIKGNPGISLLAVIIFSAMIFLINKN